MATVEVSKLSKQQLAELACTYSALILYDDGQDITGQKISKLINSSGVKIESYWAGIFAKALEGQNIPSFFNFGGSEPAAVVVAAKQAPKKQEKKVQAKKEAPKKKQQPKEQEEEGGMGGLFD